MICIRNLADMIRKLIRVIDHVLICGQWGKDRDQILRKAKGWGVVSSKNWTELKLTEKISFVYFRQAVQNTRSH